MCRTYRYRPMLMLLILFHLTAAPTMSQDHDLANLNARVIQQYALVASARNAGAYLSPNGQLFAHLENNTLCIYSTDGNSNPRQCAAIPENLRNLDPDAIQWSPDSSALAFSSDFFRFFVDSDIWVFNLATRVFTNLTDDGDFRPSLSDDNVGEGWVDVTPQWVGNDIYFLRYQLEDDAIFSNLMRIPRSGGDPEFVTTLASKYGYSVYRFASFADGSAVVHNYDTRELGEPSVRIVDLSTGGARSLLITAPDPEGRLLNTVPIGFMPSPDQSSVLIGVPTFYMDISNPSPEVSLFQLLNTDTTASTPTLIDPRYFVNNAGWSPDGQYLAYTVRDSFNSEANGLYVTTQAGVPGRMLLAGEFAPATPSYQQGLTWAANDLILVTRFEDSTPLVTLIQIDS